jgi:methionine-rich copper-binding protein CopC
LILALLALSLAACASNPQSLPLLRAEPAADSLLTRAPRTLRLYFSALPDVSQSDVSLTGPNGNYQLREMHNMADDDLMMEIMDDVSNGHYTVTWATVIADDLIVYQGSFDFDVQVD